MNDSSQSQASLSANASGVSSETGAQACADLAPASASTSATTTQTRATPPLDPGNDMPPGTPDAAEKAALDASVTRATDALLAAQQADGHWLYELEADATIPAEYVLLVHYLGEQADAALEQKIARYLRRTQLDKGGWPLFAEGAMDVSASVKAYFALKMIGDPVDAEHMARARAAILAAGGAEAVNVFTRILLALFGMVTWRAAPVMPVEIVLLPMWFPVHLSKMSYWARTVIVPLLVLGAKRPVARNPRGVRIDELFRAAPVMTGLLPRAPHQSRGWFAFFRAVDGVLRVVEPLFSRRLRQRAINAAVAFVDERLNGEDGLGGIFPAMANAVMMYAALGYPADHPHRASARRSVEKLLAVHEDDAYCQACLSPVWDTSLAAHALLETGDARARAATWRGLEWLRARQILDVRGDWISRRPNVRPGGWAFQYANPHYPDVDDTAVVVMAMHRLMMQQGSRAGGDGIENQGKSENRSGDQTATRAVLRDDHRHAQQDPRADGDRSKGEDIPHAVFSDDHYARQGQRVDGNRNEGETVPRTAFHDDHYHAQQDLHADEGRRGNQAKSENGSEDKDASRTAPHDDHRHVQQGQHTDGNGIKNQDKNENENENGSEGETAPRAGLYDAHRHAQQGPRPRMDENRIESENSPPADYRHAISRAREWLVGMQSSDGGWGAFEPENTQYYLNNIPFADHGALLDPPTADVSARCLSMLAQLGEAPAMPAASEPAQRALGYLLAAQEANGSWYGRWGMNYIYGTWSALCALNAAGLAHDDARVRRAAQWLIGIQNADGGWGEDGASYRLDYRGHETAPSTASQTAWALLGLMAAGAVGHPAVARGIAWLQHAQREHGLWDETRFTATGFPRVFYLRYHGYRKFFPLWALARYRNLKRDGTTRVGFGM